MSVINRNRTEPAAAPPAESTPVESHPPGASTTAESRPPGPSTTAESRPPALTNARLAWFGASLAAVVLTVLVVFMLQNTGSVEVTFLWMHGSLPLAMALFVAGVGASLLTVMVVVARVTQLRRRLRQHS